MLRTAIQPQNSINSDDDSASKSSFDSTSTTATNDNLFNVDTETIFACCLDYNSIHDGDLSVRIADRVSILYDAGTDYILVKHLRTQKCGYIPRICVLNVNKFLADLS